MEDSIENGATPTAVMSKENVFSQEDSQPDWRDFIKGASCAIGAALGAVPMAAGVRGLRVVLDPLPPTSCQRGFEGKRTDGIQLPIKGAMSHAIKELISSIPILRPSEATPNRVPGPITKMASSSANCVPLL